MYRFNFCLTRSDIESYFEPIQETLRLEIEPIQNGVWKMIPPSYLFKDMYRRRWLEPDEPAAVADSHRFPGPGRAVRAGAAWVAAMLGDRGKRPVLGPAAHACD